MNARRHITFFIDAQEDSVARGSEEIRTTHARTAINDVYLIYLTRESFIENSIFYLIPVTPGIYA